MLEMTLTRQEMVSDDPDYKQQDPVLALAPPKSKSKSQKHTLEEVDKGHEDPEEPKKRLKMSNG